MAIIREQGPSLSYEVDTLGFLNAQLRDLRGFLTLAHELLQNADDAKASAIIFDARDEALVVENDKLFTDCGQVEESACGFGEGSCDFHQFRRIASGGKRLQEDTIGAFGIGFISVYQVTDSPEIESGSWSWRIDLGAPAHQRIQTARLSPPRDGTAIRLPWARRQSPVRVKLAVEPVADEAADAFIDETRKGLSRALLFLRHLNTIEIRRNGTLVSSMRRTPDRSAGEVVVEELIASKAPKTTKWHVLSSDFRAEADRLRQDSSGRIEAKRRSLVQVAFSAQVDLVEGRFYASLPTEHTLPIPLFINADFFPTNDRKSILLDNDYQGKWNRAAIECASRLVAGSLVTLCSALPMERFWGLLEGLWQCRQTATGADPVLRAFWDRAEPAAKTLPIVLSTTNAKLRAADIRLLQSVKDEREAVTVVAGDLGIPIVTPDLNKHRNLLLALGVPELNVRHLVAAMGAHDLIGEPIPISKAPQFAQDPNKRPVLARQISRLQKRAQGTGVGDTRVTESCRICLTTDGQLASPSKTRNGSKRERKLFDSGPFKFLAEQNDPVIGALVAGFALGDALVCLAALDSGQLWRAWQGNDPWWTDLFEWFESRRPELHSDKESVRLFAALPIWPSSSGLHPLHELSMPGSFSDPLKLASLVHQRLAKHRDLLVNVLGATPLDIVTYAVRHVPKAFAKAAPPSPELVRDVVRVLAQHNGALRESEPAKNALSVCELVECEDGEFRSAPATYFRTELVSALLGDDAHYVAPLALASHVAARELFAWMGVSDRPSPQDLVGRVRELAEGEASLEKKAALADLLAALGPSWSDYASAPAMRELRDLSWLPAKGSNGWKKPGEVAASFREYLFDTQATFVDLSLPIQQNCAQMFEFLGVQANPTVLQVTNHLLACAVVQRRMNPEVYRFLNDNVGEVPVGRLRGQACILLSDGTWKVPSRLFWTDHGLHPFLHVLDPRWRDYSRFLAAVDVQESPGPQDVIGVLLDLARDDGQTVAHELRASVARRCWALLNGFLEREEMLPGLMAVLSSTKTIPLPDGTFGRPDSLLLDDRPWISRLFGDQLAGLLIARQEGIGLALQTAGLRPLSGVVVEESTDLEITGGDETLRVRLCERALPLARVFSSALDIDADDIRSSLSAISVSRASSLGVIHRLPPFEPAIPGHREEPESWLEPEGRALYVRADAIEPWTSIARQIAIRLAPTTNISQLTPALRDVLSANSPESAQALLDELGFTTLENPVVVEPLIAPEFAKPPDEQAPSDIGDAATPPTVPSPNGGSAQPADGPATPNNGQSNGPAPPPTGPIGGPAGPTGPGPSVQPSAPKPATEYQVHARSYVVHKSSNNSEERGEAAWKDVADAGVKHALAYEYKNGRKPRALAHNHPGWDIESKAEDAIEVERFIEVKATKAKWGGYGVGMTDTEYEKALELGDRYWLYVVDNALGAPRLYAFQNPAARVSEYRFDDGWQQFADESDANRPRSILDLPRERT